MILFEKRVNKASNLLYGLKPKCFYLKSKK